MVYESKMGVQALKFWLERRAGARRSKFRFPFAIVGPVIKLWR
jgi:hypothetical protein